MSDFEKEIHNMFDHIWDCEIDHPVYQDTVGELMEAVIQAYEKHNLTLSTNLAEVSTDCISRHAAIDALYSVDEYNSRSVKAIKQLPPIQSDIVRCEDCKYAEYIDDVKTLWCTECGQGRTVAPNDFCSYAERREVTT